jgi:hypothetical protein
MSSKKWADMQTALLTTRQHCCRDFPLPNYLTLSRHH